MPRKDSLPPPPAPPPPTPPFRLVEFRFEPVTFRRRTYVDSHNLSEAQFLNQFAYQHACIMSHPQELWCDTRGRGEESRQGRGFEFDLDVFETAGEVAPFHFVALDGDRVLDAFGFYGITIQTHEPGVGYRLTARPFPGFLDFIRSGEHDDFADAAADFYEWSVEQTFRTVDGLDVVIDRLATVNHWYPSGHEKRTDADRRVEKTIEVVNQRVAAGDDVHDFQRTNYPRGSTGDWTILNVRLKERGPTRDL
jgi:hypothetical protein